MRSKFTLLLLSLCAFLTTAFSQNHAIILNGTTSVVNTSAFIVPTAGDFTVEFWALAPSLSGGLHEFVSQGTSGGGFYIGYDQGTVNIRGGDNWQNTGAAMPVNQWTHIALVKSRATPSLYVNPALKGSLASGYSITAGGSNFTIGKQFSGFNEFMNANMDEIRVWNVARTGGEIEAGLFGVGPAATGLVAYYNANEGSGTTLSNSTSTPGLDGTLTSTTWAATSPIQSGLNALTFNGSTTQVIIPAKASYDLTTGTVEASVFPTLLDGTNRCIVANRASGGTRFSFHANSTQIVFWNGTTPNSINYSLATNTWTHLAFVANGTTTDFYADSILIGTFPTSFGTTATGQSLNLGVSKSAGADGEFWQGAIDEVRIWSTQQSAAAIKANMGVGLSGSEPGLVGLFNFNEGNGGNDNTA